jgi:hypothetical protein
MSFITGKESQGEELHAVMMESLKRRGVLGKISANIRAEVFHTLEDKTVAMPEKPVEVFLATELIREFLMSSELNSSLSVFNEESGQPAEMRVDREFLGGELGFNVMDEPTSSRETPLLVLLVSHLLAERKRREAYADVSLEVNVDDV